MTLIDGEKNGVYLVKEMNIEQLSYSERLKSIGVASGSHIKVINKKERGGLIIQVEKKQIALCRNVASGIVVEFEKKEFPEVM
ncbi:MULTISPECIES: ferrous iron transport protein A [unclassified Butyrivibrio]|uniref:ferrous iron transport protein A n=1 Tax=unclassified Butyrivibrio TaxID=2639466 RepID=UPI000407013D|nr:MULTISPECIES: ferrous iron transport protein A [unclassified Butyrivibrio]